MNFLGEGLHYQEMINAFRRLKVANGAFPNKDDMILPKLWLDRHISKMRRNTEEQSLFEPPANVKKWPTGLKKDENLPDSFRNQDRTDRAWTYLDPVGPGISIPTTGAVTTNVVHFLGDISRDHDYDFGLVIYMDMKTFAPSNRIKNSSAESSGHLDGANTNQKYGDELSFVKYNPDGTSELIDRVTWISSHNAKKFFERNKVKNMDKDKFLSSVIWYICQSRLSRADSVLNYEKSKMQNSKENRDSSAQMSLLCKDYQCLAAFGNDLGLTGTNLSVVSPSKVACGNMLRTLNRLKRKIPQKFENWTTNEVMERPITEEQILNVEEHFKVEIGTFFKWPITIIIPLRNHRTEPSHAGNFSCKYLQLIVIRANVANVDHFTEINIDPMRLGNISNVFNQISTMGNLYPKFGKVIDPKGQNFEFGQYNLYNIGTVNDYKQRGVILSHLLKNETKNYPNKTVEVLVPAKIDDIMSTKTLRITVPIHGKEYINNDGTLRSNSTIEAISKLTASIGANVRQHENLWAVGQLPALSLGLKIEFKYLHEEAMKIETSYYKGTIRDNMGVEIHEVDYNKNRYTARQKIADVKIKQGPSWRIDPTNEQVGIIKRVFQEGTADNILNIKKNKIDQIHQDCVIIQKKYDIELNYRTEKESAALQTIPFQKMIKTQVERLEEGNKKFVFTKLLRNITSRIRNIRNTKHNVY